MNDIATVAEALQKCPVFVMEDRCSAVRNRNASCRECVVACPAGAIEVAANKLTVDASLCTGCGACTSVCPTEAIAPLKPLDVEASRLASAIAKANEGRAVFACARISSKHRADPDTYVEVACLGRMEESMLVDLVAGGARKVLLVDGTCSTCKHRGVTPCVENTVAYANLMLQAFGSEVRVERCSDFPQDMQISDATGRFGSTRRGFIGDAAASAKETALTAAKAAVESELGVEKKLPQIGERLRATENGTLPQLRMPRHEVAINALDALGTPVVDSLETRLFASIDIDVSKCNACGMCAVFCPTGALKRDATDKVSSQVKYFEFSACDCVQCGMCADVCWKEALVINPVVSFSELFDFEPRTFDVSEVHGSSSKLFGAF